ncbi:GntR family transcriptional regulator [Actinocatenispora comari]|uniref:GntR family transcriptional regulator n=1 Tax=Actinocatenispora comari TaxID=2807577 RepID=A0A8J4A9Y5_9ACTN|nr:GntR family transcriptional regulator [Actinocatenispora comari]
MGRLGLVVDVHISLAGRGDRTTRIYRQLRDAIVDGRLRAGSRLPPSRELAGTLAVSRTTVTAAYERLIAEGFLTGRVGAGTFVRPVPTAPGGAPAAPREGVRPRAIWRQLAAEPAPDASPATYDFRVGVPDPDLFPLATWRRLVAAELRATTLRRPPYTESAGLPALRAAIARHLALSRSVRAGADDVVVTQGAQQAIDLLGRVLVEPGDRVAVEDPGYLPARQALRALGARLTGVPVDGEGIDVTALPDDARLVYVTPSHQFPLGVAMSPARRHALLDWAGRHGAVIVEDDYDSEFRYGARPLDPLQSLDTAGRVVYVGSFAKTMAPMLRLGFLVAPASLIPALHAARRVADWYGDPVVAGAMARFIDEGLLARHVRRAQRTYATRREALLTALDRRFGDRLSVVPSAAGLHVAARLTEPDPDLGARLAAAARQGVAVDPLDRFCTNENRQQGLALGFGTVPADQIDDGIHRLADALRDRPGPR